MHFLCLSGNAFTFILFICIFLHSIYIHKTYVFYLHSSVSLFCLLSSKLFDLVYREETLLNVIKSVTRNGRSIILTAVLALILVYLFSIVGFLFLKDDFIMEVERLKNRTPVAGTALCANAYCCPALPVILLRGVGGPFLSCHWSSGIRTLTRRLFLQLPNIASLDSFNPFIAYMRQKINWNVQAK